MLGKSIAAALFTFFVLESYASERAETDTIGGGGRAETGQEWQRPERIFPLKAAGSAFVIIDMQNFTCAPRGGGALPNIHQVVKNINRLVDFCRERKIPVIWVRQNITSGPTGDDGGLYRLFHDPERLSDEMNRGVGTEIFPAMSFDPARDHVVFKNRYSAFLARPPELKEKLDALKVNRLIVAGIAADVCVESTVRDAMQFDYEVVLVSDGVAAEDALRLRNTLEIVRRFFGDVRTAEEIIGELGGPGKPGSGEGEGKSAENCKTGRLFPSNN